jgi:hypothetical protein
LGKIHSVCSLQPQSKSYVWVLLVFYLVLLQWWLSYPRSFAFFIKPLESVCQNPPNNFLRFYSDCIESMNQTENSQHRGNIDSSCSWPWNISLLI